MSIPNNYECEGQMLIYDLFGRDTWSGRTFAEQPALIPERISEPFSKKQPKLVKGMPIFLDLRGKNGREQDVLWETDGQSLGAYMMPNFGELHKDENAFVCSLTSMGTLPDRFCLNCSEKPMKVVESKLSWILERCPDPKYNLSQKACLGILRRAEMRGKVLPPILDYALRKQAGLLVSKSDPENQGGGKGILIQEERTGTLSTLNNQSVFSYGFEPGAAKRLDPENRFVEDGTPTLRAEMGDNQTAVVYGISPFASNCMKSNNPASGIYEAETIRTLDNNGGNPACNQGGMIVLEGNGSRKSHRGNGYVEGETMYTLNTIERHAVCIENHPADSRCKINEDGVVQTLSGRMGTGGNNVPMVMSEVAAGLCAQDGRGGVHSQRLSDLESNFVIQPVVSSKASHFTHVNTDGKAETLVATDYKEPQLVAYEPVSIGNGQLHDAMSPSVGTSKTLNCMDDPAKVITFALDSYNQSASEEIIEPLRSADGGDTKPKVCSYGIDRASFNQGRNAKYDFQIDAEKIGTQVARGPGAGLPWMGNSVVRRLTPLECTRLQGFPDGWVNIGDWTDSAGKLHKDSDSPKYKALGNSIALPFWCWLADRIREHYAPGADLKMASLFDGIGGFPISFGRAGFIPVWASEIEEFPMAVTRLRFPE